MTEKVTTRTTGGYDIHGVLARPSALPAPGLLIIHDVGGMTDEFIGYARDYAAQGYLALCVDLYGGHIADNPLAMMLRLPRVNPFRMRRTASTWANWLKSHPDCNSKTGIIGWCFGGHWSLLTSLDVPMDATIVYYGGLRKKAAALRSLKGPLLGHFGTRDKFFSQKMITNFESEMRKAGKACTIHWYPAGHAFANPPTSGYRADQAALANDRSLAFLNSQLHESP